MKVRPSEIMSFEDIFSPLSNLYADISRGCPDSKYNLYNLFSLQNHDTRSSPLF